MNSCHSRRHFPNGQFNNRDGHFPTRGRARQLCGRGGRRNIAVQTPQHQVSSLGELGNTPVSTKTSSTGSPVPGLLSNVAKLSRDGVPTNLNQTNIQPAYDVYASVQGCDLGGVSEETARSSRS